MLESLGAARVLDTDGKELRVRDLWARNTVALVFVRHFGCLFCKEQVSDVAARRAEFDAKNVELVIVGSGSVEDARSFSKMHGQGLRVVTDPTRDAYCEAGMRSGMATSFSVRVVKNAMRAMGKGFRQTKTQGAATQQGGILVVAPGGQERYRYVSETAGDHPSLDEVIRAL